MGLSGQQVALFVAVCAVGLLLCEAHEQNGGADKLTPRLQRRASRKGMSMEGKISKAMNGLPNVNMATFAKKKRVIHVWHYHYKFQWQGLKPFQVRKMAADAFNRDAVPAARRKFDIDRDNAIRRLDTPNMQRRANFEIRRGQNEQTRQSNKLGVMTKYRQNERAIVTRDLETTRIKLDKKQAAFVAFMNKRVDMVIKEMNRMLSLMHTRMLAHQATLNKHFKHIAVDVKKHDRDHIDREEELEKLQKSFIRTLILVRSEAYIAEHWMYTERERIVKKYLKILEDQAKKGQILTRANLQVEMKVEGLHKKVESANATQKQQDLAMKELFKALHNIREAISKQTTTLKKFAGKLERRGLANQANDSDLNDMKKKLDELEEAAKGLGASLSEEELASHTELHELVQEVTDFVQTLRANES